MSTMKTLTIAVLAGLLVLVYMAVFTVDERKKALVVRFGQVNRIVELPGLYFKLPFVQRNVAYLGR